MILESTLPTFPALHRSGSLENTDDKSFTTINAKSFPHDHHFCYNSCLDALKLSLFQTKGLSKMVDAMVEKSWGPKDMFTLCRTSILCRSALHPCKKTLPTTARTQRSPLPVTPVRAWYPLESFFFSCVLGCFVLYFHTSILVVCVCCFFLFLCNTFFFFFSCFFIMN